ncbi:hypothetical protein GGI10_003879 [Coemansia sp. RSA 2530]|nr:hypothetical protein GGI10_003879 [Coemansia sp. RSA 2530]
MSAILSARLRSPRLFIRLYSQQQQQQQLEGEGDGDGNFFVNEDGSIRKTHAALAGIGVVGAGLLAKKLYDNFEERNLPEEKHGKHHDNKSHDYKY